MLPISLDTAIALDVYGYDDNGAEVLAHTTTYTGGGAVTSVTPLLDIGISEVMAEGWQDLYVPAKLVLRLVDDGGAPRTVRFSMLIGNAGGTFVLQA